MVRPAPIRLGGRTESASGDVVVWSVADGRRGRRWRESWVRAGVVIRTILAETEPDGRLHRLEVVTAAGLLTLHPDATGTTLHGNVVTPTGIRHLAIDWGPDRAILIGQSPAMTAIALSVLGAGLGGGGQCRRDVLWIDDGLIPVAGQVTLTRVDGRIWRLSEPIGGPEDGSIEGDLVVDEAGMVAAPGRTSWPLER